MRERFCKMVYLCFKHKTKSLKFFLWLKIFYIWLAISLQNKYCKMYKSFTYHKTNRALVNTILHSNYYYNYHLTCLRNLTCVGLWQIVYDATAIESFNTAEMWLEGNPIPANSSVCMLLVGNDHDLDHNDENKVVKTITGKVNFTYSYHKLR